jgi:hypothetical protein
VDLFLNGLEESEPLAQELTALAQFEELPFNQILTIPLDPQLAEFERAQRSLLLLPPDSPAVRALMKWESV